MLGGGGHLSPRRGLLRQAEERVPLSAEELRRVAVAVAPGDVEVVCARLLELHPEGVELVDGALVAYTTAAGEERLRAEFDAVTAEPVEPGWAERWRDFHRPLWVGPVWIGPPWEQPPRDSVAVRVDPGRAFGTGSHPTTRLCLELLLDARRGSLLDAGCGSGVLAIAGAKLGFRPVLALDRDPAAVEATRRNASANEVAVDVRQADVLAEEPPPADVAVANIDLASVEALAPRLRSELVVTAGYFHSRMPELPGFSHRERLVDGGWAADRWERK